MKRNRNSFFSNYTAQTESFIPNGIPNMNQYPNQGFTNQSMNSNIYSGPNIANSNEIDNRLSKIERQINRLDNRLTKLESLTSTKTEINETNYSNMYML